MKRLIIGLVMLFGIIGIAAAEDKHATVKVSSENFAELRQNTPLLVVDFWATWCGPCLRLAPILEEVAASMKGEVVIGKCDVDENRALAQKLRHPLYSYSDILQRWQEGRATLRTTLA